MKCAYWIYAKAPERGFIRLPLKQFDAFRFAGGKLDGALADDDRYILAAVCVVQIHYGVAEQVVNADFPRMRLSEDGTWDQGDAQMEILRLAARVQAARSSRGRKTEGQLPIGVIDLSAALAAKRLNETHEWQPNDTEVSTLHNLLDERIARSRAARDRQIAAIRAMPFDEQLRIAAERSTPDWKLELLSTSPASLVRAAVAANRSSPFHILQALSSDESPAVILELAGNTNMGKKWLAEKARDPSEKIRLAVASNPATPSFVVERMTWADKSTAVRQDAKQAVDASTEWDMRAAASEYATVASLRQAAHHRQPAVRRKVVQNPLCSMEILAKLADDVDASVREAVAIRVGVTDSRTLLETPSPPKPTRHSRQLSLLARGTRKVQ